MLRLAAQTVSGQAAVRGAAEAALNEINQNRQFVCLGIFFFAFFPINVSLAENSNSFSSQKAFQTDILIFSPHPDDETISCGGVILKALRENKKVKVVFFTNGDAYLEACAAWFKKNSEYLKPQDYIVFGQERCNEALKAAKKLGLEKHDLVFLGFPENGLLPLWEERYNTNYESETTKSSFSPYESTFNRAKNGYNRRNLLADIKDILRNCPPKKIYLPHPLDTNSDHQASTYFVDLALKELKSENNHWIDDIDISYYLIYGFYRNPSFLPNQKIFQSKEPYVFSQIPAVGTDIRDFKRQKEEALRQYGTQLNTKKESFFLSSFINDIEFFWDVSNDKSIYLEQLEEEWFNIGKSMKEYGFNVNLGPVVDVADDIEDLNIHLVKRRRIYSQYPDIVTELASGVIAGLTKGGIRAVLKHFPGLGSVYFDTHISLPIESLPGKINDKELLLFKQFIQKEPDIWIMVDHVIYPSLSDKPASLSYEIQTGILRNKLGFKGIIITDELLNMQSVSEFAYREKIKEPRIGEIIVRVFQAGTDIALIYPPSGKTQDVIGEIVRVVKQAVFAGRIKETEINDSVERILMEKERIFGKSFMYLFKKMSLEDKICQKIIADVYNDAKLLNKYKLCGIRPRLDININALQEKSKIPLFILAQHEGGVVNERLIKLYTRSAYTVGREFERFALKTTTAHPKQHTKTLKPGYNSMNDYVDDAGRIRADGDWPAAIIPPPGADYDSTIQSLIGSMDRLIGLFSQLQEKGILSAPQPNYLTPLTVNKDATFELKPYNQAPVVWLRSFPDEAISSYAYKIFKCIYQDWIDKQNLPAKGITEIIPRLNSLKQNIERFRNKKFNKTDENK